MQGDRVREKDFDLSSGCRAVGLRRELYSKQDVTMRVKHHHRDAYEGCHSLYSSIAEA